jgi:hypothetical protein
VSKFHPDAQLYEPPPPYSGHGWPRVKGAKVPTPEQGVAAAARTPLAVAWYGGGRRDVAIVSDTGWWYQAGQGLVAVRWVFVQDVTGNHRDEYLFTTDVAMSAPAVIEAYVGRWNEETTFQEMRSYLGLETTRGWKEQTVLQTTVCCRPRCLELGGNGRAIGPGANCEPVGTLCTCARKPLATWQ